VIPDATGMFRWARDEEQVRRVALLEKAPVFAGLPRRFLGRIGARLFEKGYEAGDVIFREGEPGRGLFVILEGSVAITRATSRGEQTLVTLAPGASFGELALIDDLPRSATARVTAPARLLILYRTDFEALVEGDRTVATIVMRNLLRMLAAYVRRTNALLAERGEPVPVDPASQTSPSLKTAGIP